jgi:hypothetical protein
LESSSGQAAGAGLVEGRDSLQAQVGGGKRIEIEKAPKVRLETLDLLDTKIHPRRKLRMQSSRTARDSSSAQPYIAEPGEPEEA